MVIAGSRRKITVEEVTRLRAELGQQLNHIPRGAELSQREALEAVRAQGAKLTKYNIAYYIKIGLLTPQVVHGDRDTHLYGRDHIRDIMLVHRLHGCFGLSYAMISNLLRKIADSRSIAATGVESSSPILPPQSLRGIYRLRSRVVMQLLVWLLGQPVPSGVVIHIRRPASDPRFELPRDVVRLEHKWMDWQQADDHVGDFVPGDLMGQVVGGDGERGEQSEVIFGVQPRPTNLLRFRLPSWLLLQVEVGQPSRAFECMLGLPGSALREQVRVPANTDESRIVALLLHTCLLDTDDTSTGSGLERPDRAEESTPLQSLAEIIPQLSALWEYCAILTPTPDGRLAVSAASERFPTDVPRNAVVESGQPLSGWAYAWDHPIVIQNTTGVHDPRLAHQQVEKAAAAAAVPTHALGRCNGVLYVGARTKNPDGEQVFVDAETRVLEIIANVVGEMIEQDSIRLDVARASQAVITRADIRLLPWATLRSHLQDELEHLRVSSRPPGHDDNLYLVAVRPEDSSRLWLSQMGLSGWADQHLLGVTRGFFVRKGLGDPAIYSRHGDSNAQFVCFIPCVAITDDRDRELRRQLKERLTSLVLTERYGDQLRVVTYVWSMPFRLQGLLQRLDDLSRTGSAAANVSGELMREMEEALVVLPHIEAGHQAEADGAYAKAREEFLIALHCAPQNRYLLRHVAKTYAAMGDLATAAAYWERLLQIDSNPVHLRRYAHTLACLGRLTEASERYAEAARLAPDEPGILLEMGDLLLIQGDSASAAAHYRGALQLPKADREVLWLRLAEAYMATGDLSEARRHVYVVLAQRPDSQEARKLILEISQRQAGEQVPPAAPHSA